MILSTIVEAFFTVTSDPIQVRMQAQRTIQKQMLNDLGAVKTQTEMKENPDSHISCSWLFCWHDIATPLENKQHAPTRLLYKYSNVFAAFAEIYRTEGLAALYTGVVPTMLRAGVSAL